MGGGARRAGGGAGASVGVRRRRARRAPHAPRPCGPAIPPGARGRRRRCPGSPAGASGRCPGPARAAAVTGRAREAAEGAALRVDPRREAAEGALRVDPRREAAEGAPVAAVAEGARGGSGGGGSRGPLHLESDHQVGLAKRGHGIDPEGRAHGAGVHACVVRVPGAEVALHRDPVPRVGLLHLLPFVLVPVDPEERHEVEPRVFEPLVPVVHLDVRIGAPLGARPASDAVVGDDPDLAVGLPDDAVHRAHQAHGVLAVPARRREQQVLHLQAPPVQPGVAVAPFAGLHAVVAVRADGGVDHQDLVALHDPAAQQVLDGQHVAAGPFHDGQADPRVSEDGLGLGGLGLQTLRELGVPGQQGPDPVAGDGQDLRPRVGRHRGRLGPAEEQGRAAEHVALPEVLQDAFVGVVADRHPQEPGWHHEQVRRRRALDVHHLAGRVHAERRVLEQLLDLPVGEPRQQRMGPGLGPGGPPPVQLLHGLAIQGRLAHQPVHGGLRELYHDGVGERGDREQLLLVAEHRDLAVEGARPHHQDLGLLGAGGGGGLLHGAVQHHVQSFVELPLPAEHLARGQPAEGHGQQDPAEVVRVHPPEQRQPGQVDGQGVQGPVRLEDVRPDLHGHEPVGLDVLHLHLVPQDDVGPVEVRRAHRHALLALRARLHEVDDLGVRDVTGQGPGVQLGDGHEVLVRERAGQQAVVAADAGHDLPLDLLLELREVVHQGPSNRQTMSPNCTVVPGSSTADWRGWSWRPPTAVPFVEPRSVTIHRPCRCSSCACDRLTVWSLSTTSEDGSRPTRSVSRPSANDRPTMGPTVTRRRGPPGAAGVTAAGPGTGGPGVCGPGPGGMGPVTSDGGDSGATGATGGATGGTGGMMAGPGDAAGNGGGAEGGGAVAGIGPPTAWNVRSVVPTWITSPSVSRWGTETSWAFTYVPFLLPTSRRYRSLPSLVTWACVYDTAGSSMATSDDGSRPRFTVCSARSNRRPSSWRYPRSAPTGAIDGTGAGTATPEGGGPPTAGGAPGAGGCGARGACAPNPADGATWPVATVTDSEVAPTRITSACRRGAGAITGTSLMNVPLRLPASDTMYEPTSSRTSAWWAETYSSGNTMSLSGWRPMRITGPSSSNDCPVPCTVRVTDGAPCRPRVAGRSGRSTTMLPRRSTEFVGTFPAAAATPSEGRPACGSWASSHDARSDRGSSRPLATSETSSPSSMRRWNCRARDRTACRRCPSISAPTSRPSRTTSFR